VRYFCSYTSFCPPPHRQHKYLHKGPDTLRINFAQVRNALIDLLLAVSMHGSISAAARALGLSYRHEWGELKRWEDELPNMPVRLSEEEFEEQERKRIAYLQDLHRRTSNANS
jgi:hypothetical protein